MSATYKLTYRAASGLKLKDSLPFSSLDYIRKENDVGELTATFPPIFPAGFFAKDSRFEVWRSINGGAYYLDMETAWFVVRPRYTISTSGESIIEVKAGCANILLKRRTIAYDNGTSYTNKLDIVDRLMKNIIRENYGLQALDAVRNISAYLSVQADTTLGAIVGDTIGRKRVLDVLKRFAAASEEAGIRIIFDVVHTGANTFEFRTYAAYRGNDHSRTSSKPVIVASEFGNLSGPELIEDYTEEINHVYAGGKGEESLRLIAEASDAARIGLSPFARSEGFVNASNVVDPILLQDVADAELRFGHPRILFNGRLLDTPAVTYGLHYRWGDLLTAQYAGRVIDCRVETVHVHVDSQQGEQLDVRLKGEQYA